MVGGAAVGGHPPSIISTSSRAISPTKSIPTTPSKIVCNRKKRNYTYGNAVNLEVGEEIQVIYEGHWDLIKKNVLAFKILLSLI